jgi:hypothetical protein
MFEMTTPATPGSEAETIETVSMSDGRMHSIGLGLAGQEDGDGNYPEESPHSLPTADEVRNTVNTRRTKDCHPFWIVLMVLLFATSIIGLSVGLTSENRKGSDSNNSPMVDDAPAASPESQANRLTSIREYLVDLQISTAVELETTGSHQNRALNFMSALDRMQMQVPPGGMNTQAGFKFVERYVMTVFFYATDGPRWNYNLLFLSEHDTCDWFFVFGRPVGQVGCLCNQQTNKLIGISFSK